MDDQARNILGLFVITVVMVVGFPFGGFVEDLLWMIGDRTIDELGGPLCNTMNDGSWKDQCYKIHSFYYMLKPAFLVGGVISGFFAGYGLAKKLNLADWDLKWN